MFIHAGGNCFSNIVISNNSSYMYVYVQNLSIFRRFSKIPAFRLAHHCVAYYLRHLVSCRPRLQIESAAATLISLLGSLTCKVSRVLPLLVLWYLFDRTGRQKVRVSRTRCVACSDVFFRVFLFCRFLNDFLLCWNQLIVLLEIADKTVSFVYIDAFLSDLLHNIINKVQLVIIN